MIDSIGDITQKPNEAKVISSQIRSSFGALKARTDQQLRIAYLIWKNPLMAAGRDTFINTMLEAGGFENAIQDNPSRYPELTDENLQALEPDLVFLSSEPFPFKGKHTDELRAKFPELKFVEVDGELFSWYGSRLLKSAEYIRSL
jgi:ABC-type Fe3+-hydroxamate transport system substrate-binding protein